MYRVQVRSLGRFCEPLTGLCSLLSPTNEPKCISAQSDAMGTRRDKTGYYSGIFVVLLACAAETHMFPECSCFCVFSMRLVKDCDSEARHQNGNARLKTSISVYPCLDGFDSHTRSRRHGFMRSGCYRYYRPDGLGLRVSRCMVKPKHQETNVRKRKAN